jgi:hypothetical protein
MRRRTVPKVRVPGIWQQLWDKWRGEETRVVRFGSTAGLAAPRRAAVIDGANDARIPRELPLLVLRYPRSKAGRRAASTLENAYRHLATVLQPSPLEVYQEILPYLPGAVVVILRQQDPAGCLGHARPEGMESETTRALASEIDTRVGEIDMAWQQIAQWQPQPLASLALDAWAVDEVERRQDQDLRVRVAMLTVLFHEMEHLAFPERPEHEVRRRSDRFYQQVLAATLEERGQVYGMEASPSPLP